MNTDIDDCWNRTGVRGDRSCDRLREHTHCRNCDVYASAAGKIMERALPSGYRRDWAQHFAPVDTAPPATDRSALVFRVGREWLSFPAHLSIMIAETGKPHRIPHRAGPVLAGLVNIKGSLYPCMSLSGLLEIGNEQPPPVQGRRVYPRLLLLQFREQAFAVPVDDLYGIHRHSEADIESLPSTADKAIHHYVVGVLRVDGMHVGCLDAGLVGYRFTDALK